MSGMDVWARAFCWLDDRPRLARLRRLKLALLRRTSSPL